MITHFDSHFARIENGNAARAPDAPFAAHCRFCMVTRRKALRFSVRVRLTALPIVGVNTFRNPKAGDTPQKIELARSTDAEKQSQLIRLADFHARHAAEAPQALAALQQAAINNDNVFEKLMDAVRVCSLGQITTALFEVGGQYRRNM